MGYFINGILQGGLPDPSAGLPGDVPTVNADGDGYELDAPSGGVDTSQVQTPSTGWTRVGTGTVTPALGSAVVRLTDAQVEECRYHRLQPGSPAAPMLEVQCRIRETAVPASGGRYYGIGLGSADWTQRYSIHVDAGSNTAYAVRNSGGGPGPAFAQNNAAVALSSNNLWLKIVARGSHVSLLTGQGSGATPPTTWTLLGTSEIDGGVAGRDALTHVVAFVGRGGGGSGDCEGTWSGFTTRSLLGAPQ